MAVKEKMKCVVLTDKYKKHATINTHYSKGIIIVRIMRCKKLPSAPLYLITQYALLS